MDISLGEALLYDPILLLELGTLCITALYILKLSLSALPTGAPAVLKNDDTRSLAAAAIKDFDRGFGWLEQKALFDSRRKTLTLSPSSICSFFEVGNLISTSKRSLHSRRFARA